jgi:hypothetical protein
MLTTRFSKKFGESIAEALKTRPYLLQNTTDKTEPASQLTSISSPCFSTASESERRWDESLGEEILEMFSDHRMQLGSDNNGRNRESGMWFYEFTPKVSARNLIGKCCICGSYYQVMEKGQQRKYCSDACKRKNQIEAERAKRGFSKRSELPQKTCEVCGVGYKPNQSRQRFCGRKCNDKYYSKSNRAARKRSA